ncbi:MAG: transposase [Bacteroidia bacterium]
MRLDDLKCVGGTLPHGGRLLAAQLDLASSTTRYTDQIRRVIYTTNTIEGFNRQLRKSTKTKGALHLETRS